MRKNLVTLVAGVVLAQLSNTAFAQQAASAAWGGWARCQVTVQGPGYNDQQTHTWTLTGGAPTAQGAFQVYAGTWSVVGGGSLTRTQGDQTLTAQWATNGPGISAPLAVFVRASDNRMFIQSRHAQLRSAGAIQGYQQVTIAGKAQTPGKMDGAAYEWAFPVVAVSAPAPNTNTNATANGSSTSPTNGSVGPMQPAGSQGTASCTWQFGQGSAAPAPPPTLTAPAVPTPGNPATTSPPANNPPGTSTPPGNTTPPDPPTMVAVPISPGVLPLPALCTLRGPEMVVGTNYVTPDAAYLDWNAVGGAKNYSVSRSDIGVVTSTPLAPVNTSYVHAAQLSHPGTYVYKVTANYQEGCGSTSISLNSQPPVTPDVSSRLGSQPGQVTLTWAWPPRSGLERAAGDYTGVLVTGAALPATGREVQQRRIDGDHIYITGVPAGSRTWTVKAYWDTPGGRVIDNTGKTITVTVP